MLQNKVPAQFWEWLASALAVLLLVLSIFGTHWIQRNSSYYSIGNYELYTYEGGLYLGNLREGVYYNFSAYDSYYIDPVSETTQAPLLPYSDSYNVFGHKLKNFVNLYKSYFKKQTPSVEFFNETGKLVIESTTTQNTVDFVITENTMQNMPENNLLLTFTYSDEDKIKETTPSIEITNPKVAGSLTILKNTTDWEFVQNDTFNKILFFKVLNLAKPSLSVQVN